MTDHKGPRVWWTDKSGLIITDDSFQENFGLENCAEKHLWTQLVEKSALDAEKARSDKWERVAHDLAYSLQVYADIPTDSRWAMVKAFLKRTPIRILAKATLADYKKSMEINNE